MLVWQAQAQGSTPARRAAFWKWRPEAQKFKVISVQLEASLGYWRPAPPPKKKKKKQFLFTSSFSSVLFLSKPVLERGAPDTGVTHHAQLLSTKSVKTQSPRQSPRRGKRNSVGFFPPFKEYFLFVDRFVHVYNVT